MNEKHHSIFLKIIILAIAVLTFITAQRYPGSTAIYLLFSLSSTLLLINGIRKESIYFETFLGIFFWLGFWLKFSIRASFFNLTFFEQIGFYNGDIRLIDKALIISSTGFIAFLSASFLRKRFQLFSYNNTPKFRLIALENFYYTYRTAIMIGFFLLSIFVAFINFRYGIYQKGLPAQTILPLGLNRIITWLILFGLSSIFSFFVFYDFKNKKNGLTSSILYLSDCLFTNVSLLSRGFILNGSSLLMAHYFNEVQGKVYFRKKNFKPILVLTFLVMFIGSIILVNHFRSTMFNTYANTTIRTLTMLDLAQSTKVLFIDRWVGIEGAIAVASYDRRGLGLWKEAWSEKYKDNGTSFYDLNLINSPYKKQNLERHHFISLPGFIAFSYYADSYLLLFVFCFLAGAFGTLIESIAFSSSGGNMFFGSLIGQVMAYRYAHFGYAPAQSYLLFGTIIMNIAIFVIVNKILAFNKNFRSS